MIWTTAAPAVTTAFLSSLVEAVEALTIVLAVASVRGWRPAALGALAGLALLLLIVVALGPILNRVPLHALQLVIGVSSKHEKRSPGGRGHARASLAI